MSDSPRTASGLRASGEIYAFFADLLKTRTSAEWVTQFAAGIEDR